MLLVAGRDRPPHWVKSVLDEFGSWMAEASEGGVAVTPDSTHYIDRDEPLLVVSAIRRVVFPSVENTLERVISKKSRASGCSLPCDEAEISR